MLPFKDLLRAKGFVAAVLSIAILLAAGCAEYERLSQEQIGTGLGALAGGVSGALVGKQFGPEPASL